MAYDKQLSSPQGTSNFKREKTRATSAGSKANVLGVWKKSKYSIIPAAEKEEEGRPDYEGILALVSVPDSSDTTRDWADRAPDPGWSQTPEGSPGQETVLWRLRPHLWGLSVENVGLHIQSYSGVLGYGNKFEFKEF